MIVGLSAYTACSHYYIIPEKTSMIRTIVIVMVIAIGLAINSCRKHKMDDMNMEKNINYPVAYVVNGEDGTLSVIKLADNTVTETIELMESNSGMAMWPHHIYKHHAIDMTHLAIAAPGMDLSAGHSGAMPGMKGRILILDAVKGMMVKELEVPVMNHNAVYSPDGKEIWTSQMGMSGKVLVYDATTYALKNTITVGMEPAEVTFSADGSKAYVANGGDDNISVINPSTKAVGCMAITEEMVVAYDSTKISNDELQKKIASVGHDTDKYNADDKVYKKLPGCCLYDRKKTDNPNDHSGHQH